MRALQAQDMEGNVAGLRRQQSMRSQSYKPSIRHPQDLMLL